MTEAYKGPAILELMGHRRIAGLVSEVSQYGTTMIRVDIPSDPPVTQFYGGSAIYAMTPTTQDVVDALARNIGMTPPVYAYELRLPEKASASDDGSTEGDGIPY